MMSEPDPGILLAGGGIVGLSAACLLADAGFRVRVIDPAKEAAPRSGEFELRTYSITPASARVLNAMGVWRNLDHGRIAEFRSMEVWDAGSSGRIRFDTDDIDDGVLGYIVEHGNLVYALQNGVRARNAIDSRMTRVQDINFADRPIPVRLHDGDTISTGLVVAADGANSRVRELAGVSVRRHDYCQQAVVCNVSTSRAHGGVARQRFLRGGPLAFLPLAEPNRCSVVWSTTPDTARWACHVDEQAFCQRLSEEFEYTLGRIEAASRRLSFPLRRLHAESYSGPGFALIGDAAHVVHPLAGQGLNLGIMDAAVLAEVLGENRVGDDGLWTHALRRYARWRRSENLAMLSLCEGLNRLFSEPHPAVRWLRGVGLNATNVSGPLKHWLAARAAGSVGDQPKVARR